MAVIAIVLCGIFMTKSHNQQVIAQFEVNNQGLCSFEEGSYYQLQTSSRISFLGCWLVLQPTSITSPLLDNLNNNAKILFFIYRDSLSKQDFSRLSQVIRRLND